MLRVRYRLQGVTWEELLQRLDRLEYRAALVGPEGTGKTTLLEDLGPKLVALGFRVKALRLDRATRSFDPAFLKTFYAGLRARDIILLDGAEQMRRWAWHRFKQQTRQAGGLIITSHRPGLLPTLWECSTTPELLGEILAELLGQPPAQTRATSEQLFRKHHGNLREALREMYDVFAGQ